MSRFPGNCLCVALVAWIAAPLRTRIRLVRNRAGRWHVAWERDGRRFEFYARGRSRLGYLRNLLYVGQIKEVV